MILKFTFLYRCMSCAFELLAVTSFLAFYGCINNGRMVIVMSNGSVLKFMIIISVFDFSCPVVRKAKFG